MNVDWTFWGIIVGILAVVGLLFVGMWALFSGAMFSDNPVSNWTTPEAIFYGCGLIAIAIFIKA